MKYQSIDSHRKGYGTISLKEEPKDPKMKYYQLDLDFNELLKETARVYAQWKEQIECRYEHMQPRVDPTLSKNTYNLITLSTPLPTYYQLWKQVFANIKEYYGGDYKHLLIHSWLNVHRSPDLNGVNESLGWHLHDYCNHHGFVHLSDKETDTEFKNGTVIKNKQGQMYMGDSRLEHRVVSCNFKGLRASIGIDLLDDPKPEHFNQAIFVPIV